MIKVIKFSKKVVTYNTETQEGFEEILNFYDRKIKRTVSSWVPNIPGHDIDDLSQICRMKLVDALDKFNDQSGLSFSTYVYTVWKRKLSQLSYQFKTKKYSRKIENDNYISFNYAFDRNTNSFFLKLGKHKCPLSKELLNSKTCKGCEHSCGYESKTVERGLDAGKKKKFSKCGYFKNVLDQRGVLMLSINAPIGQESDGGGKPLTIENFLKQDRDDFAATEFQIELEKMKDSLDQTSFIILQLLASGYSKTDVIRKINIDTNILNKSIRKLGRSFKLKRLIQEHMDGV
jgi:RNA polymerase sigma factor (sigma-70 family)